MVFRGPGGSRFGCCVVPCSMVLAVLALLAGGVVAGIAMFVVR